MQGINNPQHVICLQTVLKLARWQVVAEIKFCETWDLQKRKCSIGNTAFVFVYKMKYDYEKLILPSYGEFYKLSIDI